MSKFVCPKCTHASRIFPSSSGGAELMAVQYGVELLGSLLFDQLQNKLG